MMIRALKHCSLLCSITEMRQVQASRTLYSAASLGLDNYVSTRERVQNYLVDNGEKFRGKMSEFVEGGTNNMIFTEDLKNMVHIVEKDQKDIDLTVNMIKKFNAQNKEVRFGNFIFGPIVMRMFHHLKEEEKALECFKNPELEGFFDQLISYQILVDMLYEKQCYKEVRDVFNVIKSRQIQGGMYPKHVVVVVFAACYKENTQEAFDYSTSLWKELNDVGHIPMRKTTTFAAALALAQNAPHIALEIITTLRQQNYMTVRNIKSLALAQLGRADSALLILRSLLEVHDPAQQKTQTVSRDVLEGIKAEIEKKGNQEEIKEFAKIEKYLTENQQITDTTLAELLCAEIVSTSHNPMRRDRGVLAASYTNDGRRRNYNQYGQNNNNNSYQGNNSYKQRNNSRPGLTDLY